MSLEKCTVKGCGKTFRGPTAKQKMNGHMTIHRNRGEVEPASRTRGRPKFDIPQGAIIECPKCKEEMRGAQGYSTHMRNAHGIHDPPIKNPKVIRIENRPKSGPRPGQTLDSLPTTKRSGANGEDSIIMDCREIGDLDIGMRAFTNAGYSCVVSPSRRRGFQFTVTLHNPDPDTPTD